jgi:hypothetical protein
MVAILLKINQKTIKKKKKKKKKPGEITKPLWQEGLREF